MIVRLLIILLAATQGSSDGHGIQCLKVGENAIATWTNAKGQTCSWSGVVGVNFGINPVNKGECVYHFARPHISGM